MFREKINVFTSKSPEEVINCFEEDMKDSFDLFPTTHVMVGSIKNNELRAVFNPFMTMLSDPFASRIRGSFSDQDKGTRIALKVSPGWIVIGLVVVWLWLALNILLTDAHVGQSSFSLEVTNVLAPLILCKIKLLWDRVRLKSWIDILMLGKL